MRVHDPDLLLSYEPVEGAREALTAWAEKGHTIDIVTGRPTSARDATIQWLDRQKIPYESFVMVDKYNRPGNDPSIAISKERLAERPYDLAVEDSREMSLFLADTLNIPVALYDRPWNAENLVHDKVVRCRDWEQIRRQA